jgi:hypothetical protein
MNSPQRFSRQTTEGSLSEYIEFKYERIRYNFQRMRTCEHGNRRDIIECEIDMKCTRIHRGWSTWARSRLHHLISNALSFGKMKLGHCQIIIIDASGAWFSVAEIENCSFFRASQILECDWNAIWLWVQQNGLPTNSSKRYPSLQYWINIRFINSWYFSPSGR